MGPLAACKPEDGGDAPLEVLDDISKRLCMPSPLNGTLCSGKAARLPSVIELGEIMNRLRAAMFPGYFGLHGHPGDSLRFHMAANLDSVYKKITRQMVAGFCFAYADSEDACASCEAKGGEAALSFMKKLPEIKEALEGDVQAAFEGDPAARSPGEAIFCYPSITAMFHYRIAHELYKLESPVIARIIAEMSHSKTGIDIHPGARIGRDFFIDHGTGVVIGETCVIGDSCRLYQGVTLGALSFPKNEDGSLTKGIPRHPILEDDVTVYAGATILGRVTIGKGSVIGGNVWITQDVPPDSKISQEKHSNSWKPQP